MTLVNAHESVNHQNVPGHSYQQVEKEVGMCSDAHSSEELFETQEDGLDYSSVQDSKQCGISQRISDQSRQPEVSGYKEQHGIRTAAEN